MKTTAGVVGASMFFALLAHAGCSSTNAGTSGNDGGVPADASTTGPGGGAALTCAAILDCITACPDTDTACPDRCAATGSPDAIDQVTKLATCIDTGKCQDVDCVRAKCAAEVTACLRGTPSGHPLADGSAPPAGAIPADLVGTWRSSTILFAFAADGTVDRARSVTNGTCHSESGEHGTAVASGTTLTMFFTSGSYKICGQTSMDPYHPVQEAFTYEINPGTSISGAPNTELRLVQQDCKYTDASSIGLYCTESAEKL